MVDHPARRAWSNVPGILMRLEVRNTIISIIILPIKPAIMTHREFIAISQRLIFVGPNHIYKVFYEVYFI